MFPDVLENVSARQPRADDAKRKQRLRDSEEGHYICVRNVLPPHDLTVEPLIRTGLSPPS